MEVQIAFHKLDKSDWAEDAIRQRIEKLAKIYDRIVACRVTVDQRAVSGEQTIPPVVHIEVSIPGAAPLIVAYEPDRLQRKFRAPDLGTAINDAFGLAERRLADLKDRRTGRPDMAEHDIQNQFLGQIADLHPEEDHGFLLNKEGGLLYFHRNSMLRGDFDALRRGDEVHYVEEIGDTGPLAVKVRKASREEDG